VYIYTQWRVDGELWGKLLPDHIETAVTVHQYASGFAAKLLGCAGPLLCYFPQEYFPFVAVFQEATCYGGRMEGGMLLAGHSANILIAAGIFHIRKEKSKCILLG
jgi:hypothetical protein